MVRGALTAAAPALANHGRLLRITTAERVGLTVGLALVGLAAAGLGAYGWRRGAALLPRGIDPGQVAHRLAVLRRGCVACVVAGLGCVAAAAVVAAA